MRISLLDLALLTAFPFVMAVGQLLFKQAALAGQGLPLMSAMMRFLHQPIFYGAVGLYGLATLFWLWLLTRYSLALAYPFAVLAVVFVPLLEKFLFQQKLGVSYWLGLSLIIGGVLVIVQTWKSA